MRGRFSISVVACGYQVAHITSGRAVCYEGMLPLPRRIRAITAVTKRSPISATVELLFVVVIPLYSVMFGILSLLCVSKIFEKVFLFTV